jgi:hypothetical protein
MYGANTSSLMMKPGQTFYIKKKAPKKRREKETRGNDQSPGKQTAQKRQATRRKGNYLGTQIPTSRMI